MNFESLDTPELHQQLIALAEVMPAIVWISDADGEVFHASAAFYDFVGRRDIDLRAGEWIATIHPDDHGDAIATWGRALSSGEVYSTEFRLRRHDGSFRWHLLSGQPVRNANGTIAAWYGAAIDVDESRRERDLVTQSEQLLEELATGGSLESVVTSAVGLLEHLLGGEWRFDESEAPSTSQSIAIPDGHGELVGALVTSLDLADLNDFELGVVRRAASLVSIAVERDRADRELQGISGMLRLASRLTRVGGVVARSRCRTHDMER